MTDSQPTVLLVEDEPDVAASFELMLESVYDVRIAGDGEQALGELDDDVDVVLLDRMMPGMSGGEVLDEIREREVDCRVVMVTAVDPDFDIIEMGFDDYVAKPPTATDLRETVADVLERADLGERVREYHSLLAKRSALQEEKSESELAQSPEFAELDGQIAEIRRELADDNERLLEDSEFVGAFRALGGDRGSEEAGQ